MGRKNNAELAVILLALVPFDGSTIGNQRLRQDFAAHLGRVVGRELAVCIGK
jgi:hypothetical protein